MEFQGLQHNDGNTERIRSRSYPALQEAPAIVTGTQNITSETQASSDNASANVNPPDDPTPSVESPAPRVVLTSEQEIGAGLNRIDVQPFEIIEAQTYPARGCLAGSLRRFIWLPLLVASMVITTLWVTVLYSKAGFH